MSDEKIQIKLDLLKQSNVIADLVYDSAINVYSQIKKNNQDFALIDRFITHYAMAMQRIHTSEQVGPMQDLLWSEIKASHKYDAAISFLDQNVAQEFLQSQLYFEEKKFLVLHLVNLL